MVNVSAQLTPWICRRCQSIQAYSDGRDLYFGRRKVPANPVRVDWICTNCKKYVVKWRSDRNLIDITDEKD